MLRIFLPITCLGCTKPIDRQKNASVFARYLCEHCLRLFEHQKTIQPDSEEYRHRFRELISNFSLFTAFEFAQGSLLQQLIHNAKYHSMMNLATALGSVTASVLPDSLKAIDYIIPIPLHRTRYSERGYNQSEKIARGISAALKTPIVAPKALVRVKPTPSQTGLSESEREENVKNAFVLREKSRSMFKGKTIMLVDDVMTTGATLASAATELDKANPAQIIIAAVAMANSQIA